MIHRCTQAFAEDLLPSATARNLWLLSVVRENERQVRAARVWALLGRAGGSPYPRDHAAASWT